MFPVYWCFPDSLTERPDINFQVEDPGRRPVHLVEARAVITHLLGLVGVRVFGFPFACAPR